MVTQYDAAILQKYADRLYSKAALVVVVTALLWLFVSVVVVGGFIAVAERTTPLREVVIQEASPAHYQGPCDLRFPNSAACQIVPARQRLTRKEGPDYGVFWLFAAAL